MKRKDICVITCGIFLFLLVGMWAVSGGSTFFDTYVYNLLHMLPENVVKPFFVFITKFGNTDTTILLIAILTFTQIKKDGLSIAGVGIFDVALNQGLKLIFKRERPVVEHLVHASGYSFPSGHTMIAIMLFGYLIYYLHVHVKHAWIRNLGSFICAFLMIFVPVSRIYVGVHYATDIIGGIIIGFTALYFYIVLLSKRCESIV